MLTQLEELSLEENRISSLDGVDSLKSLRKLDVGKNSLSSVRTRMCVPFELALVASYIPCLQLDAAVALGSLCQLSVEDNQITSLAPLAALRNLMELYIGNNGLDNLKVAVCCVH
jgi:Leucine-rich repeat (LRR) protein